MKIILVILGIIAVMAIQFICFILSACLLWFDDTFFNHEKITFRDSIKRLINSKDVEGYNDGIIIYLISPLILAVSILLTIGLFLFNPYKWLYRISNKEKLAK